MNSVRRYVEKIGSTPLRWLLFAPLLFMMAYASAYVLKVFSPNRNDAKLKETERLFDAIPIYPGSELVDTSGTSKDRTAGVGRGYKSNVSYDALKQYYMEKLQGLSWHYEGERELFDWGRHRGGRQLSFRQGEFELKIEYAGVGANFGWDYAINVIWIA